MESLWDINNREIRYTLYNNWLAILLFRDLKTTFNKNVGSEKRFLY